MNQKPLLKGLLIVVLVVFAVAAVMYSNQLSATLAMGEAAPEFELPNLDDQPVALADLRGKVVIMNFWTSWCTECTREMPEIEKFWKENKDRVVVLGINVEEMDATIEDYVAEHQLTFPILKDKKGRVKDQYLVRGYPETFFIDGNGVLQRKIIGPMSLAQMKTITESLLK